LANPIIPVDTRKEIAQAAKISHGTLAKVKVIEAKASAGATPDFVLYGCQ
jgi:hypothetical protein